MNYVYNGFDAITLIDSRGFMENKKCHFLRKDFIIATKIFNDIKVFSLEIDNFRHKCVVSHALVFHIIEFIAVLNQESHKFKRVLKLSRIIIISHRIFLLCSCERRLIFENKVQNLFNHHVLLTIPSYKTVVFNQTQPNFKILFKSVPMLCDLIAHHFSIFLQKL